jgi:hypothetical protein
LLWSFHVLAIIATVTIWIKKVWNIIVKLERALTMCCLLQRDVG